MPLLRQSPFALGLGLTALMMGLPALLGAAEGDWKSARAFLQTGLFTGVAALLVGLALGRGAATTGARREIAQLVVCWILIPVFAAIPLVRLTPSLGAWGAYFEMVAAFTTTGGTAYGDPERLPAALNLWRGTVGWFGGFLTLVSAYVVLAPRRLGGFEVETATWRMQDPMGTRNVVLGAQTVSLEARSLRAGRVILPVYLALTATLGLIFSGLGQGDLASAVHAMAIISTSGISPYRDGLAAAGSLSAEIVAAVFLVLAATRLLYARASPIGARRVWHRDPELWLMAGLVALVTAALFLRHWIGALTIDLGEDSVNGLEALWGNVFTVLSFLTTTGFESGAWASARDWSGLANPGLFLLALAAIGGGAATTAGGIKLIRAYALLRHGLREMVRIAQPYGIVGVGARTRSMLREGPIIVWSFIMLFIFAILMTLLGLTASGLAFDTALIAAISAISNTGPAFAMVSEVSGGFAAMESVQRMILAAAMVVGRIEVLALIALFNPDFWREPGLLSKNTGKPAANIPSSDW